MADRTVYVELDLRTGKYSVGADEAIAKTDEVDEKIKKTNEDLDKTERKATEAAAAMKLLGSEGGSAMLKLDDRVGESSTSLEVLEAKLFEARLEVRRLADEFDRTGSGTTLDKLFEQQGAVKDLESLKGKLTKALETGVKDAEPEISKTVHSGVGDGAFSALSGADSPMVLGIVAAAPLIASAVGVAITAGAGLGLIGLGAYLQKDDPGIQAGFKKLENDAIDVFAGGSEMMIKPLQDALVGVDQWLLDLGPTFKAAFAAVAPAIGPLFQDIKSMLGPIIAQLPALGAEFTHLFSDPMVLQSFSIIGSSIGDMFGTIASNGTALKSIFVGLAGAVKVATTVFDGLLNTTNALEAPWVAMINHATGFTDALQKQSQQVGVFSGKLNPAIDSLRKFSDVVTLDQAGLDELSQQINATVTTADMLAGTMTDKVLGSLLAVKGATLSWHQGLTALQDSLSQNGRSFDENTKAGQANMAALLQVVSANKQAYDSNIANGMSAADAAKKFDDNTAALDKVLKKAGLTDQQIQGLTGDMNKVPDEVNTNIAMHGLTEAIEDLGNLILEVNGLPPNKTVRINYVETYSSDYSSYRAGERLAAGGIRRAATGLIIGPSDPGTLIGEPQTGGEALIPLRGIGSGRAQMLGNVAMSGYGMQVVPRGASAGAARGGMAVSLSFNTSGGGTPLQQAMSAWFQDALRTNQIQIRANQISSN